MVENTNPFWLRYQSKYVLPDGKQIIWGSFDVSEEHLEWLSESYYNYIGFTERRLRYKNSKGLDPQVKMFLDQEGIVIPPAWSLPQPNKEAAFKSLAKYAKSNCILTPRQIKNLNKALEWTERQFMPYMGNSSVLSMEEAVSRLDKTSSSGFPFNRLYKTKGELLDNDSEFLEWLEEDWERLAEDPLWTTVASNSLKEELRPLEKIAKNSIRTFTAMATDATVQGNRLFVEQNEKMYAAHTVSASAIGMSPLKGNWEKLFQKLNQFKKGYALDESEFDSSIRSFLLWGIAHLRWKMLREQDRTPENLRRIRTYYRNIICTVIWTPEGILIMKKGGMPSGCVNTVTDNTLILYTMLSFAWIELTDTDELIDWCDYNAFESHTAKALLGDDNTWSVSDAAHEFYNARSVIDKWKLIGITTTTDSMEPRDPIDLDFLSAHTVIVKGVAVPLYDRNKLMTSLLYAPQKRITPATTLQRCTNLLQIGWTDIPFRKFCRALIDWLLSEYDKVMIEDPRWIVAKSSIMSDEAYFTLFTNRKAFILPTQSYQETQERYMKLDNKENCYTMSAQPTRRQQPKSKKVRKQNRGPKKGNQPKPKKTLAGRRTRGRGRGGRMGGRMSSRTALGVGATSFGRSKARTITVSNDEFIGAVTVANQPNFNNVAYAINPGQATTFPWLSKQAAQWEKYRFSRLEFYFKREVSEFATAGSAGKVIMSVDFDASDAPPTTKQQMEDTIPHVDGMPCENITLVLPQSQMNPQSNVARYVRPGGLPGNADIKTYDVGNLNIATQGIPSNTEVGELRVRYICVFSVPVLESSNSAPANNQVAQLVSAAGISPGTTVGQNLPFEDVTKADGYTNGIGAVNAAGQITLPAGNYLVDVDANFVFTGNSTTITLDVQKNAANIVVTGGDSLVYSAGSLTTGTLHQSLYVSMNGTDYLNASVQATYSTGTVTVKGVMRIVAV